MASMIEIPEVQVVKPGLATMPQAQLNGIQQNGFTQTTNLNTDNNEDKANLSYENTSFIMEEDPVPEGALPPLTYVDFMPQCLGTTIAGKEPDFGDFKSVMDQANQWLESMPQYSVHKCETITMKLHCTDYKLNNDAVFSHLSSNGLNTFLRGVRLWLVPKEDLTAPTPKISYLTVLPDHDDPKVYAKMVEIMANSAFRLTVNRVLSQFDSLPMTIEKLNRHLLTKPIPGKILSVEVFPQIIPDSLKSGHPNTEVTCWSECGKTNRLYIIALRVFFMVGESAFESIGMHDTVPDIVQNSDGFVMKVKYAPFNTVVTKTSNWLKEQEGIRIISIQSPYVRCEKMNNGSVSVNSGQPGYTELCNSDTQFVKTMRIFYIKDKKMSTSCQYDCVTMSSRLFVPVRKFDTGREFEGFSKTMQRVINWLNLTKIPLLSMETVQYQIQPDSWGPGIQENRVEMTNSHCNGRYYLTCIRLYFPVIYCEPPAELLKTTVEDEAGWGCVVQ